MLVHFLYPSDPIDPRKVDEPFREQAEALRSLAFGVSVFGLEDLGETTCKIRPQIPSSTMVVYRGWMLEPALYEKLLTLIRKSQGSPFTSLEMYLACHYLPNWYPLIPELTAETKILPAGADFQGELRVLGWGKYFIKDYVKSLKTSVGSVVSRPEDMGSLLAEMQKFRGTIEGGVCVRRFEDLVPGSEKRYFVIHGRSHAASGSVPELVLECARRIKSPFFSVDVAMRADGILRVIEIGDGQVSDLVGWDPVRFAVLWRDGAV